MKVRGSIVGDTRGSQKLSSVSTMVFDEPFNQLPVFDE